MVGGGGRERIAKGNNAGVLILGHFQTKSFFLYVNMHFVLLCI